MPKPDVSLRSSKKQGDDELRMAALTRDDVAKRLGVSAYGFEPRGLRWEVFVRIGEEPS